MFRTKSFAAIGAKASSETAANMASRRSIFVGLLRPPPCDARLGDVSTSRDTLGAWVSLGDAVRTIEAIHVAVLRTKESTAIKTPIDRFLAARIARHDPLIRRRANRTGRLRGNGCSEINNACRSCGCEPSAGHHRELGPRRARRCKCRDPQPRTWRRPARKEPQAIRQAPALGRSRESFPTP